MTNRPFAQAVAGLVACFVLHACTFMRPSSADSLGRSYADLSALIDDAEHARAVGLHHEEWLYAHDLPASTDRGSWDAVLGELHARRASSLVRRAPVVSLTETWVGMMSSDYRRRSDSSPVGLVLGCVLLVPPFLVLDVIVVPVSFSSSFVQDLRVDEVDRARAEADLRRASELGVERAERWMW